MSVRLLDFRNVVVAAILAANLAATSSVAGTAGELATAWTADKQETRARMIVGAPPSGSALPVVAGPAPAAGSLLAVVEVELAPRWKTYWKIPGDAGGVPPLFDWSKSVNVKSARVLYPAPERIIDKAGDLIGYHDRVAFPVVVEPADVSRPVALKLMLDYGVCLDICIPVMAEFSLEFAPGAAPPLADSVASVIASVPRSGAARLPVDPKLASVRATLTGNAPSLVIEADFPGGARAAEAFVEGPEGFYVPLPKKELTRDLGGGRLRFEIGLEPGPDLAQIRGKSATVTLVSAEGRSEATFVIE